MKKITLLYDFLKEVGGLERVLFFQANALIKKHTTSLFFSYIDPKQRVTELLGLRQEVTMRGSRGSEFLALARAFFFPSSFASENENLLITHSYMTTRMAARHRAITGTPFITMIHHPPNFLYGESNKHWVNNPSRLFARIVGMVAAPIIKKLDREAVRQADLIIANSRYTQKRIMEIYGKNSKVIYPSLDLSFRLLPPVKKTQFRKKQKIERSYILAHGRIIPDKRYIDVLPLLESLPELDLYITGTIEKNYLHTIIKEVRKRNLGDRVRIIGKVNGEDLVGYYNCAQVFVMPAPKEDFGLTVAEAQACGCPVVAWNEAGPSEIVNSDTGILVESSNLKQFGEAIDSCSRKTWDRKKISKKTLETFSAKVIERQFLEAVNSVLRTNTIRLDANEGM